MDWGRGAGMMAWAKPRRCGFGEALLDLGDGAEFAEEAQFAQDEGAGRQGAVHVGAGDGQGDGGVGGGVVEFDAADDVDEDVFVDEAEAGAFFEDGDDHGDAGVVGAGDFAFGGAEHGVGGEGLDFDHAGRVSLAGRR